MKTLNKFLSSILNVLFSAYGVVEQKKHIHIIISSPMFAIFRQVGGIGAFTEVPNTRFAFVSGTFAQSGKATIPLTAGDVIVVRNVSGTAIIASSGSVPNSLSASVCVNKVN